MAKFCRHCGTELQESSRFCPSCGKNQDESESSSAAENRPVPVRAEVSPKSRTVAAILCFFLGCFGVHRFYVGKIGTGVLMIFASFFVIGEVWALVDFIVILCGNFRDKEGLPLSNWDAKY